MFNIPRYIKTDVQIMLGILVPYSVLLNTILFGERLYQTVGHFIAALLVTLVYKCITWQCHTLVAVYLRKRMPEDTRIVKRIGTSLICFFIMTILDTTFLIWWYDRVHFQGFEWNTGRYTLSLLSGIVLNIFATLFHEGRSNFERWKLTLTETEQLKTAYLKSQVEGLRSQVQPHFLFNSINTLSALIGENPVVAEEFLNELSKVYRYLLRQEGQFAGLEKELSFIRSYYYILKARYGDSLYIEIQVNNADLQGQLPPFTLHLLIEEILQQNTFSKRAPITIRIQSGGDGCIQLQHTAQESRYQRGTEFTGLANIQQKFRLLGITGLQIRETEQYRSIDIPLQTRTA